MAGDRVYIWATTAPREPEAFRNEVLGVFVPPEKPQLTLMPWTWHGTNRDIIHAMWKREVTPYAVTKVDYITGCGLVLTVDMIPPRARLRDRPVTCLQCTVAEINPDMIPGR